MKFKKLKIIEWRQFAEVEFEFHPRITIITGANGAGKSTVLKILSQHFGWSHRILSTPRVLPDSEMISYFQGLFKKLIKTNKNEVSNSVGVITYDNGINSDLNVPENNAAWYTLDIPNQQTVIGVHINSHRQIQSYQQITKIPVTAITAEQAYNLYNHDILRRYQGQSTEFSPIYRMKESIISMATFGAGNDYVQKNPLLESLFIDFKSILSKVLPPTVGFLDIKIRIPDVVIVTETGEFMIDDASGGLMAIIDLAWQIFLFSHKKEEFTVTIDEPENHLHPSMQRSLLRRFTEAFPKAQFIVATHSPFIVSSIKDSFVYVLRYVDSNDDSKIPILRRISSLRLDTENKAATANEILREVLGVPVTLPEWAEDELHAITKSFNIQEFTPESINNLRQKLEDAGLGEYYPEALRIVVGTHD